MNYEISGGTAIKVKAQRFRVPEILIHPEKKEEELTKNVMIQSINLLFMFVKIYINVLFYLVRNPERLTKYDKALASEFMRNIVKVIATPVNTFYI